MKANLSEASALPRKPAKKTTAKPQKRLSASSVTELIAMLPAHKKPLVDPSGPLFGRGQNWVKIVVPAPHSGLHAHNKGSFYSRASLVKALAQKAQGICLKNRTPRWDGAFLEYRFFFSDDRTHDAANAVHSMKAAIDGIVRAGLIPDDSYSHLWIQSICCGVDRKNPRTELIFHQSSVEAIKSLQDAQLEQTR